MTSKRVTSPAKRGSRAKRRGPLFRSIKLHRKRPHRSMHNRRYKIVWWRLILITTLGALCLYGAVSLALFSIRSIQTRHTNRDLQDLYEDMIIAEASASTEMPTPNITVEYIVKATPEPQLLETYQYISDALLPEVAKIHEKNADTVAWLNIPGVVNLPVVYRNNTYYLNHDFNGRRSSSGTLFLDEAHPLAFDTQYLVIHGHNMFDGSMFGVLSHYTHSGYVEAHPIVYWSTLYRQEIYEVIAVLYLPIDVTSEGYVPYVGMRRFDTLDQFYAFADTMQSHALYWRDGEKLFPNDALLTLSTCDEDHRIVVLCKRTLP